MDTLTDRPSAVSNVVVGKILHKESGRGIRNLLVDLFDLDAWQDPESDGVIARDAAGAAASVPRLTDIASLYKVGDRIGSAITDASGQFRFDVTPKDLNLSLTTILKVGWFLDDCRANGGRQTRRQLESGWTDLLCGLDNGCAPTSQSQEVGAALGAHAGEAWLRRFISAGGFRSVRGATETPFNMILEARP
jgi:hypothetical protein